VKEGFVDTVFGASLPRLRALDVRDEREDIRHRVIRGGFPEIMTRTSAERRKAWFGSYLTTILQRDVRDLSRIEDITAVPRLLSILASRASGLLNAADLSRGSGIAQTTLKRYLSLLQTVFLFQELPPWSENVGKRFVKMPKVFLSDSGLTAHLLGASEQRIVEDPPMFGPLLENFVCMELRKQIAWSKEHPQLFHWRTHSQQEVDLVLESGGRLVGIEVKASSTVTANDFKGLKALAAETRQRFIRGVVLFTGSELLPFGQNLTAMPVSALWRIGT
jgi:predicted AAA+ superfamily ATPase